ncbi:hypothetical protein ACFFMM_07010 [Micromonospora chaiyaphumensis]|nr:hypothetical protein [Micromonospora chaiyaphumensis]
MREDQSAPAAVRLKAALEQRELECPDYWSHTGAGRRELGHGLFAYPAMMVPQLQGALLDDLMGVEDDVTSVFDPFMGSGTVLLEARYRGLSFTGADINPLAVLIATVKSRNYDVDALESVGRSVIKAASNAKSTSAAVDFPGINKWFREDVIIDLSRIRRAITQAQSRDDRQALWVILAETVRLVSNSRTSTVKLHAYPTEYTRDRVIDAQFTYQDVFERNIKQLRRQNELLRGLAGSQDVKARCLVRDARASANIIAGRKADVLMTSPPYGDNKTTVSYGQHSYLPLQWIEATDIPGFDPSLLSTTYAIDNEALGGSLSGALHYADSLAERSNAIAQCLAQLQERTRNARQRFLAFFHDLDASLDPITSNLKPRGWMFWTLGERKISGLHIPTVQIVRELLESRGAQHIVTLERKIPKNKKRMALRNGTVETISRESVLVMQSSPRGEQTETPS